MDRGAEAKATLSTYNTWTQFESFAQELPLPTSQAPLAIKPVAAEEAHTQYADAYLWLCNIGSGGQRCLASRDSGSGALSHSPAEPPLPNN